jgi:hypothetical protein
VLCEILHGYLLPLGIASGIDMEKENFPDKEWLVLAVASLSGGKHAIFARDYVPAADQLKRNVPQQLLVHNNDGLLDIPEALRPKYGKGRSIKMATLSKKDKI